MCMPYGRFFVQRFYGHGLPLPRLALDNKNESLECAYYVDTFQGLDRSGVLCFGRQPFSLLVRRDQGVTVYG